MEKGSLPDLQCGICYEKYSTKSNIPMVLGCGHSLCSSCLKGTLTAGGSTATRGGQSMTNLKSCPHCRKPFPSTLKKIEDFSRNFELIQVIDSLERLESEMAQCLCGTANSVYCKTCKKYICDKCVLKHERHTMMPLGKETAKIHQEAEASVSSLHKLSSSINNKIETLQKAALESATIQRKAISRCNGYFDDVITLVQSCRQSTLDKIISSFQNCSLEADNFLCELKVLSEQINSCLERIGAVYNQHSSLEQILQAGRVEEFVKVSKDTSDIAKKVATESSLIKSINIPEVKFEFSDLLKSKIQQILTSKVGLNLKNISINENEPARPRIQSTPVKT